MYRVIRTLTGFGLFAMFLICILTIDCVSENIVVDNQIKAFMDKGILKHELFNIKFYEVDIEEIDESTAPSIEFIRNYPVTSTPGDIFIYRESFLDVLPFSAQLVSFFVGGHAGVIYDKHTIIETTGMESDIEDNIVVKGYNNVLNNYHKQSTLGLRVRANEEEIDQALSYLKGAIGKPYNYSFIFAREKSYYCTDLVSRAFSFEAGLNFKLDKDGIATSCNDLILSKDTFITYYMYYEDDIMHMYYGV